MKIKRETISTIRPEVDELLKLHYEECENYKSLNPLDFDWELCGSLERLDKLYIFTIRVGKRLLGYCVVIPSSIIYSKGKPVAQIETFYVHPSIRKGLTSYKFFKYVENYMKILSFHKIRLGFPYNKDYFKFFDRLGYSPVDFTYEKGLI